MNAEAAAVDWPAAAQPGTVAPGELPARGARRDTFWTGPELFSATFPPLRWAVDGLLPEGLSLLVGAPKVGKSWAALDIALAVATGGTALGALPCTAGDVLYLALEDSPRRVQDRCRLLLGDHVPGPPRFSVATEWQRGQGAVDWTREWLLRHPEARLVIVDTLARVKPPSGGRGSAYDDDTAALVPWQALASHHRVAVVFLHHDRKASVTDFVDAVSGTHGLAGVADSTLVLQRDRMETYGRLLLTGRDVEEHELSLRRVGPAWQVFEGPVPDSSLGDLSARIVRAVVDAGPDGIRPADVASALDEPESNVRRYLARLVDGERLRKLGRGLYVAPVSSVPSVPTADADAGGDLW